MYGLTMAAIEQVAQQGLACVTHMNIDVRCMHFYILLDVNAFLHHLYYCILTAYYFCTGCFNTEENSL